MKKLFAISIIAAAFNTSHANAQDWSVNGNAGTTFNQFIGTTDNKSFRIRTNNSVRLQITNSGKFGFGTGTATPAGWFHIKGKNNESQLVVDASSSQTNLFPLIRLRDNGGNDVLWINSDHVTNAFFGQGAGQSNNATSPTSEGKFNTFIGRAAGYSNGFGSYNTAMGNQASLNMQNGVENTAIGSGALMDNISGSENTAVGSVALESNTGNNNTAIGKSAAALNSSGSNSVAIGHQALYSNTTIGDLVAIGKNALYHNGIGATSVLGTCNTAVGSSALYENNTGDHNTSTGFQSMYSNTDGYDNVAYGSSALFANTTGGENCALGHKALENGNHSETVAVGSFSGWGTNGGVSFTQCTFIGTSSYPTVARTNVTMLGANVTNAQCTGNNQVLLGNTAISQIRAQVTGITAYSDARYKTNVKEDIKGLDFILRLNPVSYHVRPLELHKIWGTPDSQIKNIDFSETENVKYTGFIAQEVEKAAKESGYDFTGIDVPRNEKETYALRYTEFIMPIVKAIKEQQEIIEKQNDRIAALERELENKTASDVNNNLLPSLTQNNPNPFREKTTINFQLPAEPKNAVIKIFSLTGEEIKSITVSGTGFQQVEVSGSNLSSGTYNYLLIVDGRTVDSKQMTVTK